MNRYYQLGGVNAAVLANWKSKIDLASEAYGYLVQDGKVQLTLGIKSSGASYLYLTEDALLRLRRSGLEIKPNKYLLADELESLSPIAFNNVRELGEKLDGYKQKPGKKKNHETLVDLSPLNKPYHGDGSKAGIQRGQFENARVLFRLFTQPNWAPAYDFELHGLPRSATGTLEIPVYCFAFNLWTRDERPLPERRTNPIVLDIAVGKALSALNDHEMETAVHIRVENNKLMERNLPVTEAVFRYKDYEFEEEHGGTILLSDRDMKARVQQFFADIPSQAPAILLVHSEQADKVSARDVLQYLGVAGVDTWNWSGDSVKALFHEPPVVRPTLAPGDPRARHRQRSASPPRRASSSSSAFNSRHPSPPPAPRTRVHSPIYTIDIKSLYTTLFNTSAGSESIPSIIHNTALYPAQDCAGWCAGNELWMLLRAFCEMARRGPVDDQKPTDAGGEWPEVYQQMLAQRERAVSGAGGYDEDVSDYGSEED
ncbi:hypothetical protein MKEN_01447400 [Mycena kentingensis (nom. inval.)]|nr:hypothetical protein MKEN_01447400 [Mycena kentingensis (nom. inval.)]